MKKLSVDVILQAQENKKPKKKKKQSRFVMGTFEWMQAIAVAVIAVVILMTFVCRVVNVDGGSMKNTLLNDDKICVYTLFYTPKQGDIVVISHAERYDEPIVKRVIATEGQSVDIDFDTGKVYVDGSELDEPYITYSIDYRRIEDDVKFPLTVPHGCTFVLGDNRVDSLDSRSGIIGFIQNDYIIGKVVAIISPINRIGLVS